MSTLQENLTTLQEAEEVYKTTLNQKAALHESSAVVLADGSTTRPNIRGSEIILAVEMSKRLAELPNNPEIITTLYSAKSIAESIKNTPYNVVLQSTNPEIQQMLVELGYQADEHSFIFNSAGTRFVELFGDPLDRINNILFKGFEKSKNENNPELFLKAVAKAEKFLGSLSATLFTNSEGLTYPQVIIEDRLRMIDYIRQALYPNQESTQVSLYESGKFLYGVSLRNVLEKYPEITNEFQKLTAMTCECPECSLAAENGNEVGHVVGFNGQIYKNSGSLLNNQAPFNNCSFIKRLDLYLKTNEVTLLDLSIGDLIDCGFKLSGKLTYLVESLMFQNPNILNAVRDYSNPRGTVKMAMGIWQGLDIITPRIYIKITDESGKTRDANGYELINFMNNGGSDVIKLFAQSFPNFSDERVYELNITTGNLKIS